MPLKRASNFIQSALTLLVLVLIFPNSLNLRNAHAHGTIISPESRIYKCRFRDNPENPSDPACAAAKALVGSAQPFYDWTGVRQGDANGNHQSIISDGELCGGGNSTFRGINLIRTDWRSTPISADANGKFEFIYHATAPHATRDMIFYITKQDWAPNSIMRWSDMQEFCRFGSVPLVQDNQGRDVYRMSCDLPQRSGKHVIFQIWQRSDSGEAFYSCSDVEFAEQPNQPNPNNSKCQNNAACMTPLIDIILGD